MSATDYTETEALLLALQDAEVDSGNTDLTDAYLRENFLPGELQGLARGAYLLAERARAVRREMKDDLAFRERMV